MCRPRRIEQCSVLDVAPTVLSWTGLPSWPHAQGQSLLASLGTRETYGETDHTADGTHRIFLRGGAQRWKVIASLARGSRREVKAEWYDLAADPGEHRSAAPRAEQTEALLRRARERWQAARSQGQGAPAVSLTAEQRERLRALGYVGP